MLVVDGSEHVVGVVREDAHDVVDGDKHMLAVKVGVVCLDSDDRVFFFRNSHQVSRFFCKKNRVVWEAELLGLQRV